MFFWIWQSYAHYRKTEVQKIWNFWVQSNPGTIIKTDPRKQRYTSGGTTSRTIANMSK